jgi:hypothetical protein
VHQYLARYGPALVGEILAAVREGLDGRLRAGSVPTASAGSGGDGG